MRLTLKIAIVVAFTGLALNPKPVKAGIPVFDGVGLVQHIINALENVRQTLFVINSYQTQLQQFEYEIKNSLNPNNFIWGEANVVINDLLNQVDTLRSLKQQFGSISSYLSQYKTVDYYNSSNCLSRGNCTNTELNSFVSEVGDNDEQKSKMINATNEAVIKGLDRQQELIQQDAVKLRDLQRNAQSSKGHLEAIQSANQLASAQAEQLMQIRMLMVSQQAATTTQSQAKEDTSAQEKAVAKKLREPRYVPTPGRGWIL
jgi:P-type conjugative transfer protein TrbJ